MHIMKLNKNIYLEKPFYSGYECNIYKDGYMLYKIFKTSNQDIINNKLHKIEHLSSLDIEDAKPIDIIEIDGKKVGYSMSNFDGYSPLDSFNNNQKKKIEDLKKIKEKIKEYHQYNIILGDLRLRNILEKNGKIIFCDLDNAKIGNYDFDQTNYCQDLYLKVFDADNTLDTYMLNIITISYLTRVIEAYCIERLKNKKLPFVIDTRENKKITEAMILLNNKDNIKPFIDYQKTYIKK